MGGMAYIPFKSNSTVGRGGVWEKIYLHFVLRREDFLRHDHARSNVESTFSAIKRKFGDSVRSKGDVAMANEVLCKVLAHNLCCCISAWYELGVEPTFTVDKPDERPESCGSGNWSDNNLTEGGRGALAMVVWISAIALLFVLIYFLTQKRRADDAWQRYRRRRMARREPPPDRPIDETFIFDKPSANSGEDASSTPS